jgi:hypothetical protein
MLLDENELRQFHSDMLIGYGDDNWRDSAHHDYQYMISKDLGFSSEITIY